MKFGQINYLAVLVAAVAYFLLGAVWYSPLLFSKPWQRALAVEPPERPPVSLFAVTFVAYFVTALAMAFLAGATGAATVGAGALLGLITGTGFALTILLVGGVYEQRPPILFIINGFYNLLAYMMVGVIVAIWR